MARVRAGVRIITLTQELRRTVADLQVAIEDLRGVRAGAPAVAVCTTCRRVRVSEGDWQDLDDIVAARALSAPDGALCPQCAERAADAA